MFAMLVVYQRAPKTTVAMKHGRDLWWHELMAKVSGQCPAEPMDSEDPLFILYTSGTTGKPKGLVHTTGGYSVGTYLTSKYIFDLHDDDVYWCTADIGWITGHSYVVYGPLQNGATVLMYEGAPNWPECDRFWQIIEEHKGERVLHGADGDPGVYQVGQRKWVHKHDLSSLRLLGTVGEPINPEGVDVVSPRDCCGERCPIVDAVAADRDGRDHDLAHTGCGGDEAGFGDEAVLRDCAEGGDQGRR